MQVHLKFFWLVPTSCRVNIKLLSNVSDPPWGPLRAALVFLKSIEVFSLGASLFIMCCYICDSMMIRSSSTAPDQTRGTTYPDFNKVTIWVKCSDTLPDSPCTLWQTSSNTCWPLHKILLFSPFLLICWGLHCLPWQIYLRIWMPL